MKYVLSGVLGDKNILIEDPSLAQIEETIDGLISEEDHFIILEPEYPIGNCSFMQCILDDVNYYAEVRIEHETDSKIYAFKTEQASTIKKLFASYLSGIIPNMTEWEDTNWVDR